MAKRSPIRVGLIGCGLNMEMHLGRVEKARGVKLVAACDPNEKATQFLQKIAASPLSLHTNYRKMLQDEKLDAVLISTPHNLHYTHVRDALNAGMHVLIEKPLTIKTSHAKALLELSKKKRRILHVAYQRHHWGAYTHVRNLVRKGAIGRLQAVTGYITQNWVNGWGWRFDPVISGGGMLMDTGSHLVASMLFTSGLHVREVTALSDNVGKMVDINTTVSVRFDNDAIASLTFVGSAQEHDEILSLHGDKGSIVLHSHQWTLRNQFINGEPLTVPQSAKTYTPDEQFFKWISGAKGYERPMYAIEVARLSEATYKSIREKRPVKITN